MRRFSFIIVLAILVNWSPARAQQLSIQYNLAASAYQSGNFEEAEQRWIELADTGDANAQYALSIMHLKKEALSPDDTTAFRYLVEAAKKQHVASMFNLGVAYWEGRGVKLQREKALNWWEVAAKQGDAGAQYNLGLAYYIGEGRTQDTQEADYWAQQAANNNHPQAQALLITIEESTTNTSEAANDNKREAVSSTESTSTSVPDDSRQASDTLTGNKAINLHAAPDLNSALVGTMESGASVQRIQTSTEWTQILVSRSYPVWVYETFLESVDDDLGIIRGKNVNIRPSASANDLVSPPLGQLEDGQRVDIISRRGSWAQIMPPKPFPVWVFTRDIQ